MDKITTKTVKIAILINFVIATFFIYYPSNIKFPNAIISIIVFFILWILPILNLFISCYIIIDNWLKQKKKGMFFLWILFQVLFFIVWVICVSDDV